MTTRKALQWPSDAAPARAGFDSCSFLSEEMKGANSSAPLAMLWSIAASSLLGYALLLGMIFCVQVQGWSHACN